MTRSFLVAAPAPHTRRAFDSTARELSSQEFAMLHSMLVEQRDFRLEQLAALRRQGSEAAGRRSLSLGEAEVNRSLIDGAQAALRDVHDALDRVAAGSYGRCVDCAEPIERERLEILPQAPRCLPCLHAAAVAAGPKPRAR